MKISVTICDGYTFLFSCSNTWGVHGWIGDCSMFRHTYVPTPLCSDIPMFRHPYVPTTQPIFRHPYVPTSLCFDTLIIRHTYVPTTQPMYRHPYVPTSLCSDTPIFRHPCIATPLCSDTPMFRHVIFAHYYPVWFFRYCMVRYECIGFAVTPCVNLFCCVDYFLLRTCLAIFLFYCRGVDYSEFGRLLSSET